MRAADIFLNSQIEPQASIEDKSKDKKRFGRSDYLQLIGTFLTLLVIPVTTFVVLNVRQMQTPAATKDELPPKVKTEYWSHEVLIKVKKEAISILKTGDPLNTGIPSLNKLNKDLKVKKFERVIQPNKKSKVGADVFRWYKVTLSETPQKLSGKLEPIKAEDNSPKAKLSKALGYFKNNSNVETVELNNIVFVLTLPNDPLYSSLWGLAKIEAPSAWDVSTGSTNIVVADIDTGLDRFHPDLSDNVWVNEAEITSNGVDDDANGYIDDRYGWDWVNNDNDPMDDQGHGTHTAGTIAAVGNNNLGVVGVAWTAKIMGLKFLDHGGGGNSTNASLALIYAADNGASISNNSWGGPTDALIADAVAYEHSVGMVVVASAGNEMTDAMTVSPAGVSQAITVAATTDEDSTANFSNYGPKIDVGAPGVGILSTKSSQGGVCNEASVVEGMYCPLQGTSMSAPHVSGLAALILSKNPNWTNEEVKHAIRNSSNKIFGKEWESKSGYGRMNAGRALNLVNPPPVTKILSPTINSFYGGDSVQINADAYSRLGEVNYKLSYGKGSEPTTFTLIKTEIGNFHGAALTNWSFPPLQSGIYTLKLEATDINNTTSTDRVVFVVDKSIRTGWPKNGITMSGNHIAIGDLNNDGTNEIVSVLLGESQVALGDTVNVNVWGINGNSLPNWPKNFDFSPPLQSEFDSASITSPLLEDFDGDQRLEIIFAATLYMNSNISSNKSETRLYVLKSDGSIMSGWPKILSNESHYYVPVVGDLNADGSKEIVFSTNNISLGVTKIYVWQKNGSFLTGWPRNVNYVSTAPIIADISDDPDPEKMEIILGGQDGKVSGYKNDGSLVTGWPKQVSNGVVSTLAVGDITGDGKLDLIAGSTTGAGNILNVLKSDGTVLPGWPKQLNYWSLSVALGDVDGDKVLEIISLVGNPKMSSFEVAVWEKDGSIKSGWPYPLSKAGSTIAIYDLNNDGRDEIGVGGQGPLILNGDGTVAWSKDYSGYVSQNPPLVADLNKDAKSEIIGEQLFSELFFTAEMKLFIWTNDYNSVPGYLPWNQIYADSQHSNLSKIILRDTDNDGCTDFEEVGSNPSLGGQRNYNDPWDFFDVTGDHYIDFSDVLLIMEHFGHGPNQDSLDDKLDRYSPDPNKPWKTAPSNDGVDLSDALVNLNSFGHSCK